MKYDFIVSGECNTVFYVINNKIRQFLLYFGSFPVVFLLKKTAALKIFKNMKTQEIICCARDIILNTLREILIQDSIFFQRILHSQRNEMNYLLSCLLHYFMTKLINF